MSDMQVLLDERQITRGLGQFARILDRKSWADLPDVFARELTFNYGLGEEAGIDALERNMRRYLDRCGPTQHLIGSVIVDVDGDDATSRAYVQARHQRCDDPVGGIFDSTGEYVDRWQRGDHGWRIVRRDALWFLHAGDPAVIAMENAQLG
ncbi:nuclear transport factor 2 family protein [Novosphingobium sp. BL-8H]|uniref:nuclear transport factor 2 family protein n=1 Tax=Novosphingobium sp. BL-8H TaxID=3127640 RepID=UPI003757BF36